MTKLDEKALDEAEEAILKTPPSSSFMRNIARDAILAYKAAEPKPSVERVARALYLHELRRQPNLTSWAIDSEYWLDSALAAIAAMEERDE